MKRAAHLPVAFEKSFQRLQSVTRCKTQVQLAEFIGVRQSSISDAKRRGSIPSDWLIVIQDKLNINPNWVLNPLDDEPKFRVPSDEQGVAVNVKALRERIEQEVRSELDNLHAEDLIHRLEAMGLSVSVTPKIGMRAA